MRFSWETCIRTLRRNSSRISKTNSSRILLEIFRKKYVKLSRRISPWVSKEILHKFSDEVHSTNFSREFSLNFQRFLLDLKKKKSHFAEKHFPQLAEQILPRFRIKSFQNFQAKFPCEIIIEFSFNFSRKFSLYFSRKFSLNLTIFLRKRSFYENLSQIFRENYLKIFPKNFSLGFQRICYEFSGLERLDSQWFLPDLQKKETKQFLSKNISLNFPRTFFLSFVKKLQDFSSEVFFRLSWAIFIECSLNLCFSRKISWNNFHFNFQRNFQGFDGKVVRRIFCINFYNFTRRTSK